MGTWGTGNFENSGALDYLSELNDRLTEEIEDYFESESFDFDLAESFLMPRVAVMLTLCDRLNANPPKEETIRQWQEKYLRMYDDEIDSFQPVGNYKIERRKVIEETFENLAGIARRRDRI